MAWNALGLRNLHSVTPPHLVGIKGGSERNRSMFSLRSQENLFTPGSYYKTLRDERPLQCWCDGGTQRDSALPAI